MEDKPFLVFVNIFFSKSTLLEEFLNIDIQRRLLVLDDFIHTGLSETRLIGFIVSLFSVAYDINNDISLELLSPIRSKLMDEGDSFSIITIDVENRTIVSLTNVSGIRRRSSEAGIRRESNLIVDDNVDGTSGTVIR